MLCERCQKNRASFTISISCDSVNKYMNLCEGCAVEKGICDDFDNPEREIDIKLKCQHCGREYSKAALENMASFNCPELLGCFRCYKEFKKELKPIIRRIHGDVIHVGKTPDITGKGSKPRRRNRTFRFMNRAAYTASGWMQGDGPDSDVIISTRIRLARNLMDFPFCNQAEKIELQKVAEIAEKALESISNKAKSELRNASVIRLERLDKLERDFLVERHVISNDLSEKVNDKEKENKSGILTPYRVIIGEDETVSIMLNEEDHIRLQVMNSGLQIKNSWEIMDSIDNKLSRYVDYAFSQDFGYLTACLTNAGTGLRVSVMFHIPALASTREGKKALLSVSDMGYAIRGMYGEGSYNGGAFYQISNEATLGQSEEDILDRVHEVAVQIADYEREEREILLNNSRMMIKDKVFRAYGILTNARMISCQDALGNLSWLSLGINLGILSDLNRNDIARLMFLIRPAHLQKYEGKRLEAIERDTKRAAIIRKILKGNMSQVLSNN
ncbi:protein arginine kinase [Candidatus Poribacteria bacterium]|nr:protein arginine kinase [Candidatus Poribacteria bacterium]